MYTYTQTLYQVTFHTKFNENTLLKHKQNELYSYLATVISNKKCHAFRIGGVEDHIHIIMRLHPSVALSDLVKDIKLSSSSMIRKKSLFPDFSGWQVGYAAFTYSEDALPDLIDYVINQEKHHQKTNTKEELIRLLKIRNVDFDEKNLF